MNNEHYLIHKDDYIKHIDEKVLLYMMVQPVSYTHLIIHARRARAYEKRN